MHDPRPTIESIMNKLESATNRSRPVQLTDRELYELRQYVKYADALRVHARDCAVTLLAAANAVGPV